MSREMLHVVDNVEDEQATVIDLRRLEKGDAISTLTIEQVYGVTRGTDAYRLTMLQLRQEVADHFAHREPPVIVTLREDADVGLMILSDEDAVEANNRAKRSGVRRFRRAHKRQTGIDRGKVPEIKRAALDRDLALGGRILHAIARELRRKPVEPKPRKRNTPTR